MREPRLGDDIDDFCVRCKRVMNHAIVSVVNGEPAKVRCRTCHNDHDFRHEQAPPPKVDLRKQALFNEALKRLDPNAAPVTAAVADVEIDLAELAVDEAEPAPDAEAEAELEAEPEPEAEPEAAIDLEIDPEPPAAPQPKPRKAALKAVKPRGRKSAR
jgi:hypothetical protein